MEGVNMLNQQAKNVLTLWPSVSNFVYVPHTEQEYDQLVAFLDELIDQVGQDETHPLASLMDVIGTLVEKYEDENVPELTLE
jgi:HTH-type transcriptional regulator / antitoxin HigA